MAIIVSSNAAISVNGVDLSDHCTKVTVNDGQESREVSAMGNTIRVFRAGLGTPSITAEFRNDTAASSVETTLRGLISITSSGFVVTARKVNTTVAATNPLYIMTAIIDGDLNVLDASHGEVDALSVKFVPYSSFTVQTTAT